MIKRQMSFVQPGPELHLSVFGTKTVRSDKKTIDISNTLKSLYFVKKIGKHGYDMIVFESRNDPNP